MSTVSEPRVYTEFDDRFDQHVLVVESQLQAEPAVWIHCDAEQQGPNDPRPLLTVALARRMRDALDAFVAEHAGDRLTSDRHDGTRAPRPIVAVARQRGAQEHDAARRLPVADEGVAAGA